MTGKRYLLAEGVPDAEQILALFRALTGREPTPQDRQEVKRLLAQQQSLTTRQKELVYGQVGGSLVFLHREDAVELAGLWDAIGKASTWGEFRRLVPADRYKEVVELMDRTPRARTPFLGYGLGCVCDGDYPESPAQNMLDWSPPAVRSAPLGEVKDSVHNGQFLVLNPALEEKIVACFAASGFRCRKNTNLVLRASGQMRPTWRKRSVSTLLRALTSSNDTVRDGAIAELEKLGTNAVPGLLVALRHKDERIRAGVVHVLGKIRPTSEETTAALVGALQDVSENVFHAVCYCLGPEAKRAAPLLVEKWKHGSLRARNAAGWALGKIDGDANLVVPALIEGLQDPNWDLRMRAVYSLGRLGRKAERAVPFLIEVLRQSVHASQAVGQACSRIGNVALDALRIASNDADEAMRGRAGHILESIARNPKVWA